MNLNKVVEDLDQKELISAVEDVFTLHKTSVLPDGIAIRVRTKIGKFLSSHNKYKHSCWVAAADGLFEKMIMEEAARQWVLENKN